jgi:hypothetical protein
MNKLAAIVVTALLIIGGALWFLAAGALNDFVKVQIEQLGSEYTEQKVSVANVNIELTKGSGAINGISITNPAGYQQAKAFVLDNIALDIDVASLKEANPIVIESFVINKPQAFVEFTKKGGANVKDILDALKKHLPASSETAAKESNANEPNIKVNKLILSGVALTVDLRQLGNKEYTEQLPEINLGAIGGEKGLPASQLGTEIAKQVVDSIWQQAKSTQKKKLVEKAKNKLKEKLKEKLPDDLKDKAKEKLKGLLGKFNG